MAVDADPAEVEVADVLGDIGHVSSADIDVYPARTIAHVDVVAKADVNSTVADEGMVVAVINAAVVDVDTISALAYVQRVFNQLMVILLLLMLML